ncbi:putative G-protein coupled receptor F27E5.8 [Caenorhabditis elegans]|uniref:Probable G-protein coupled receptor F27E5.8 n=1 Tax=Caenorhabditis elegans TaxID=6239 RepID=YQV8_CAEEL|nr:putative G-protein coupled receptor F27E5.8 [Caenorhabditis elegans]Q5FC78.2 RecName: Full=Probable G-protein coupled receptor F27E5.8 [Caenorhabditis elegans]CAI46606.2 Probable G-protein coupled receptor F27E5.8 [Caenorhabditis elegans]|eukprot:NP_001022122.2 Probable G-protein coupled receptor F27E5.8 [Caenorhabditis elegans]
MSEQDSSSPKYMRFLLGNFTSAEMVTDGNFLIYCIEMGLLVIGVLENIFMIGAVFSTSCLHLNLRILICNCCLGFILMAVGRAMIAVPLCIAHLRDVDISSHAWCFIANAVHHSSADSVCLSFVFIMLERTAGTIWSKDYEKTKIHIFPCIFAFLQWFIPMFMILGNFLDRANRMEHFLLYPHLPCQIEYLTPTMFMITIFIIVIGFIASVGGITIVYNKNIKKYNTRDIWFNTVNLSERYQITENIRSTHLLFPLLALMLIFSTLSVSVLIYGGYWVSVMTKEPARFEEVVKWFGRGGEAAQLFDIITAIYTISFPICAFICHPNLFRFLRKFIGWNSYAVRPSNLNEIGGFEMSTAPIRTQTEFHFQELSRQWNT